jgi:hypothetical protein
MEVEPGPNNMEYKLRCCWNVSGNTLGTWGTCMELVGNTAGTEKKTFMEFTLIIKLIFKL